MINIIEFSKGLHGGLRLQIQQKDHEQLTSADLTTLFYEDWDNLAPHVQRFFLDAVGSHLQGALPRIRQAAITAAQSGA